MQQAPLPPRPAPDPKKQMNQFITIFIFVFAMFVLFDQSLRTWLGTIVGYVLEPLVGLNGTVPVVTLILTGIIMTALSVVLRHFFTDYVGQAESQKIVSAFNKELQKARVENNKYKIKKLTEEQPNILKKSMEMSTSQMKLMPVTMLAIIPIFAWLSVWIGHLDPAIAVVNVPWATNVSLTASNVLPNWVLLYSLISIPFGQILSRALRYFEFRKRLREIEAQPA
ncbi:MAG: EMC3/TMCO1 family protein [Methanomassiliicoccus sp.]|nr:EMC3/TMCO1 family protein [Methanomassiliicoccus sp.]